MTKVDMFQARLYLRILVRSNQIKAVETGTFHLNQKQAVVTLFDPLPLCSGNADIMNGTSRCDIGKLPPGDGVGHRDNRSSPSRGVRLYRLCCYKCVQLSRGKFFELGLVVRTLSSNHKGHTAFINSRSKNTFHFMR